MSDHQQTAPIRSTHCNLAMLIEGVIGVGGCGAEEIAKHGTCLTKGNLVLTEILDRFDRIPLELHASE